MSIIYNKNIPVFPTDSSIEITATFTPKKFYVNDENIEGCGSHSYKPILEFEKVSISTPGGINESYHGDNSYYDYDQLIGIAE